jgi:AcrR family transcriptional regulator
MNTDERRRKLRDALVNAAERVIAGSGLGSLKARDLAREVGCALGAIYTVFPDLDTLILSVNSRTLALLDRHLMESGVIGPGAGSVEEPGAAMQRLIALADGYLGFAAQNRHRWQALFAHRMADGRPVPDWHRAEQMRLFSYVEEPLRALRTDLPDEDRSLLARSLFSAVHGIVSLGLEEKLTSVPLPKLQRQLELLVSATAHGLKDGREHRAPNEAVRTNQGGGPMPSPL